ncbi:PucR family transcriptional regulator [Cohnella suwonensis]|uniref:PucR family transcriptional regulator n=1 Tax=Cohnella suwonensis TaxID=696072 RepID=A0ABW0LWK4_9BACL
MKDDDAIFDRGFDSLTSLADAIGEALLCPVTIEDAHHRLIAYSSHDEQSDPVRIATIIGRRVPEYVVRELWSNGIMGKLNESDDPVLVPSIEGIGFGDRLAVAVRRRNDVLGYIWALEVGKRFGPEDLTLMKIAASAVKSNILELEMRNRIDEKEHQEFFWQMLTGNYGSGDRIQARAGKLGVVLPPLYHVFVFEYGSEISEETRRRIRYVIHANPQDKIALHLVNGKRLVVLSGQGSEAFVQRMIGRLGPSVANAGAGLPSGDYASAEKRYQEALSVLSVREKFPERCKDIYRYEELGFYRFLPRMAEERREHKHVDASIRKLQSYDLEHQSDMLRTLELFLSSDSNVKITAETLHIHTNTLTYRLKRIEEIGDIDLDSMHRKVTLYLEMQLIKFAE